jgi:hypothetical protein
VIFIDPERADGTETVSDDSLALKTFADIEPNRTVLL